jgi:hypothetical protein
VVTVSRNHLQLSACLDVGLWNTMAEAEQVIKGGGNAHVAQLHRLSTGDLLPTGCARAPTGSLFRPI